MAHRIKRKIVSIVCKFRHCINHYHWQHLQKGLKTNLKVKGIICNGKLRKMKYSILTTMDKIRNVYSVMLYS